MQLSITKKLHDFKLKILEVLSGWQAFTDFNFLKTEHLKVFDASENETLSNACTHLFKNLKALFFNNK